MFGHVAFGAFSGSLNYTILDKNFVVRCCTSARWSPVAELPFSPGCPALILTCHRLTRTISESYLKCKAELT